jgi:competence protein ComEA
MKTATLRFSVSCSLAIFLLVQTASAALPDGPGKDVTIKVCGSCHSPEKATSLHQSSEEWENTVSKMANMGAQATDEQFNTIVAYLSKNFGPEAPPPVNLNTATAVDLESSLALLKSEAAAIIQYRSEKGRFKSIDDLRNVPGLDFKKIESNKSRITF